MLIPGPQLTFKQREQVLAAFVHRWTTDNPHRSHIYDLRGTGDGIIPPTCQPNTDAQWLVVHAFHFIADGSRLSFRTRRAEPLGPVEQSHGLRFLWDHDPILDG